MSASDTDGETGGRDLTVETLEFVNKNWHTVAEALGETWEKPVLRNADDKSTYPDDETTRYATALRTNDVVTVENGGRIDSPTGTEFDFDVEWELDVRVEALRSTGFSHITDSTDFRRFVLIVRRAILTERSRPITDPDCIFDWRWLTISNENPLPEAQGNREHHGVSLTLVWHGYESAPTL